MEFTSDFAFGDVVIIDDDKNGIIGRVTGFSFRKSGYYTIEISWMNNGSSITAWIEDWRLKIYVK